jgi:hypothetical protein
VLSRCFLLGEVAADWVKECSGGLWGLGVKVLVRDRLGLIAQVAATAAPPLVTAAVPRELRIDPCEKKSKRREFARWREGVLPELPAGRYHCHSVSIAYLLLRQRRGEVRKKIELRVGESP